MSAALPTTTSSSSSSGEHSQPPAGFSRPNGPPKGPRDAPWEKTTARADESRDASYEFPIADLTTLARSRRTKRSGKCEWATLVDPLSLAAADEATPLAPPTSRRRRRPTPSPPPSPPFRRRKSSTYSTILRTYARASTSADSYTDTTSLLPSEEPSSSSSSTADLGRSRRVIDDLLADMEAGFTNIHKDFDLEAEKRKEEDDGDNDSPYRIAPLSFSTAGRPPRRKLVDVYGESDRGVHYDDDDEDEELLSSSPSSSAAHHHRKVGRSDSGYLSS
ncbi:hypothetical protein HDU87_002911 [Geranomyces variabilis]|uniref:Uncharacterized protein n=1 Tax=Geranomyces variabilis TaxID=109894 RepID=A0AAD5TM55_9FUNG|nr:hypothetical protein HDU87_002911 [Geranomyces variabilis]